MAETEQVPPTVDQIVAFLERARDFAGATDEARAMTGAAIDLLRIRYDGRTIDGILSTALEHLVGFDEAINVAREDLTDAQLPTFVDDLILRWGELRNPLFTTVGYAHGGSDERKLQETARRG
jgi:hypothetical protein